MCCHGTKDLFPVSQKTILSWKVDLSKPSAKSAIKKIFSPSPPKLGKKQKPLSLFPAYLNNMLFSHKNVVESLLVLIYLTPNGKE